jgi:hypothetical protein
MNTGHRVSDVNEMARFVRAGNAYFTVRNLHTGNRVTFNVSREKDTDTYIVRAFTGTDNSKRAHYSVLGVVDAHGVYTHGDKETVLAVGRKANIARWQWAINLVASIEAAGGAVSGINRSNLRFAAKRMDVPMGAGLPADDLKAKAFQWFWRTLHGSGNFPDGFEFWHEGRCAQCGKRLTVPESIQSGFGPECVKGKTFTPVARPTI